MAVNVLSYKYFCFTVTIRLLCMVGLSVTNFVLSFILLNKWAGIKRSIALYMILLRLMLQIEKFISTKDQQATNS